MKRNVHLLLIVLSTAFTFVMAAQPAKPLHAGELKLALAKLRVLGSVLYVSAHPDDENTAFLATMSKGRLYRTGYLSVTRGEGGQNLIGSEQGTFLGVIRTQELLAARAIDGAEQFFTRAIDFGYSKTTSETLELWGKDSILADMVWIIRTFRPDVIVNRFAPERGEHGNHTASAILAIEAFHAAADPSRFPHQLRYVQPWQAKRILWNYFRFGSSQGATPGTSMVVADLGTYSPLLGVSFGELAGESRSMHKSQGFGASQRLGSSTNYFEHVAGDEASDDLFDGIDAGWSRIKGGSTVDRLLVQAIRSFDPDNPSVVIPLLLQAREAIQSLGSQPWTTIKLEEIEQLVLACAGFRIDVLSAVENVVPGDSLRFSVRSINRSATPILLERLKSPALHFEADLSATLRTNQLYNESFSGRVSHSAEFARPYPLQQEGAEYRYAVSSQDEVGVPEIADPLVFDVSVRVVDQTIHVRAPLRFRRVDPVRGELYRQVSIVPPVSISPGNRMMVFSDDRPKVLTVFVRAYQNTLKGDVVLVLPDGWIASPASIPVSIESGGGEVPLEFSIRPGSNASGGVCRVEFRSEQSTVSRRVVSIDYPHFPPQTMTVPAEAQLVRVQLNNGRLRVGYIMGAGDGIPEYLRQIGCTVDLLADEYLETGNLDVYDVIVSGVRAYNVRDKLPAVHDRIMKYVSDGGRYVVQYVTRQELSGKSLGPYPFEISRTRVSVENAPVLFPDPGHPLLNGPNKITVDDFSGWIQERGLYFAEGWDPHYETVIVSNDPGEEPSGGGLLYARYGNGVYIYTGYSWFRQLPAGVPGAFRLFANLISSNEERYESR